MPFLSDLASRALYFERAHSPSSWTIPSMGSLFLARYPSQHGMGSSGWGDMQASGVSLAEVLKSAGYRTAARIAHPALKRAKIGRGFDDFSLVLGEGALVTDAGLDWLGASGNARSPFFLYLHYLDTHSPYRVHPGITPARGSLSGRPDETLGYNPGAGTLVDSESKRRAVWSYSQDEVARMRQLYDGETSFVDQKLEALFEGLSRMDLLERTILIFTSDHGEEFGEHDVFGHGASLFWAVARVPLVIVLPDGSRGRIRTPVQTGGLGPTLLEELEIPVPDDFAIPAFPLRREGAAAPPVHLDLPPAPQLKLHLHRRGVVDESGGLLVGDDGAEQFFRMDADGVERGPFASVPNAEELRSSLREFRDLTPDERPEIEQLDAEEIEQLRDLGYVP
jgi:arylsulfatase A-like enzyme